MLRKHCILNKDEQIMVCIYNGGNRLGTVNNLRYMSKYIDEDEHLTKEITESTIYKLTHMSDKEYEKQKSDIQFPV